MRKERVRHTGFATDRVSSDSRCVPVSIRYTIQQVLCTYIYIMHVYIIIIIPTYTYTKRTYRQGNNGNPIDGTPPNINCAPRPKDLRFVFDVCVCVCVFIVQRCAERQK